MKLLDSRVIIAFLNEADALHGQAVSLDFKDSMLNELVLAEVANVMRKRVKDKNNVVKALDSLVREIPMVLLSAEDVRAALKAFSENYPAISFTDASLAAQAKILKASVLTFDENLKRVL